MAFASSLVGSESESIFSYMVVSAKCASPSAMYLAVSSMTMPEPLSAFLMTRVSSLASSVSVFLSLYDRLLLNLLV